MRKFLMGLGIGVLCLPMLFVCWLLAASRWSKMDALTMRAPMAMRGVVASVVLQKAGWGRDAFPMLDRVTRLDPDNADAWGRRCTVYSRGPQPEADVEACVKAVSLQPTPQMYMALGRADERAGKECDAAEAFKTAVRGPVRGYKRTESMGRAALKCGDLVEAREGLETAVSVQAARLMDKTASDSQMTQVKTDQLTDREYLIVTYDGLHEAKVAKHMCSVAHVGWKGCACGMEGGEVVCREGR
jgi:hypothetical protein